MKKISKVLSVLCSMTTFACMFGISSTSAMVEDGGSSAGAPKPEARAAGEEDKEREKLKALKEAKNKEREKLKALKEAENRERETLKTLREVEKKLKEAREAFKNSEMARIMAAKELAVTRKEATSQAENRGQEGVSTSKPTSAADVCNSATDGELTREMKNARSTVRAAREDLGSELGKIRKISYLNDEFGIGDSFRVIIFRLEEKSRELMNLDENLLRAMWEVRRDAKASEWMHDGSNARESLDKFKVEYKRMVGESIVRSICSKNKNIQFLVANDINLNRSEMWTAGFFNLLRSYGVRKFDERFFVSMVDDIMNNTVNVQNVVFRALATFAKYVGQSNRSLTKLVNGLSFERVVLTYIKIAMIEDYCSRKGNTYALGLINEIFGEKNIDTDGAPIINEKVAEDVEHMWESISRE